MPQQLDDLTFAPINQGYDSVFTPNRLSVDLVAPIDHYDGPVPTMDRHVERVRLADHLRSLEAHGIDHVALNLRLNHTPVEATLETLANRLLPDFTH